MQAPLQEQPVNLANGDLESIRKAERLVQMPEFGDYVHLLIIGGHVHDNAIYIDLIGENGSIDGIRVEFKRQARFVTLLWGDMLEFWRTPDSTFCRRFEDEHRYDHARPRSLETRYEESIAVKALRNRGAVALHAIAAHLKTRLNDAATMEDDARFAWRWLLKEITSQRPEHLTIEGMIAFAEQYAPGPRHLEQTCYEGFMGNHYEPRGSEFSMRHGHVPFAEIAWRSKRLGTVAFDSKGLVVQNMLPLFVSHAEIEAHSDGERIKTRLKRLGHW